MLRRQEPYSFSRVTTFEQCPRRFRYRYLDGVREAFRGIEAFMGQQVHAAIEWAFDRRDTEGSPSSAQLIERYCALWDDALGEDAPVVRVIKAGKEAEFYRRAGAEMLDRFYRCRFTQDRLETTANEHHFVVRIGGRHDFQGFIDRLARDKRGLLYVIDYKTGARVPRRFGGKDADQLRAYALAMFLSSKESQVELVLEYLRGSKVHRQRVERDEAALLEETLAARIDRVEQSTVFPPIPGVLCSWCGYNDICDAQDTVRAGLA